MPHSFLHIGFNFSTDTPPPPAPLMEQWMQRVGDDWLRYSNFHWITWTDRTPQQVAEQLRSLMGLKDILFVTRINTSDSSGYLPQWMWDWINQPRPPGYRAPPPLPPRYPSYASYATEPTPTRQNVQNYLSTLLPPLPPKKDG